MEEQEAEREEIVEKSQRPKVHLEMRSCHVWYKRERFDS